MTLRLTTAIGRRRRIRRVVRHVEDRLQARPDAQVSLDEMADVACLSRFHFIRLYRRAVGEAPQATIRRLRLAAARRRLIENPSLSVTDAALDHGYDSAQSFARAFRRAFGAAPGARIAAALESPIAMSLVRTPALRVQTIPVVGGWSGVADVFDEVIGRFDVADVPRRGQDMGGLISPDGDFTRACAIENELACDSLRLPFQDMAGGWRLRIAGQTHAVWRRLHRDPDLARLRHPDAPVMMRYGNDPAYCAREEQRVALYVPLLSDAPIASIARRLESDGHRSAAR